MRCQSTSSRDSRDKSDGSSPPSDAASSSSPSPPSTTSSDSGATGSDNKNANPFGHDWEDSVDFAIKSFEDLPHRLFGINQHMIINYELKEALRIMLRQFNAPIVYCFAYGSGVFPQDSGSRSITEADFRAVHPRPPDALVRSQRGSPKMIDFIFGVSHTQHWHSINMKQHRAHYSAVASLGSGFVSRVQRWGAGVYFNPYVEMDGMLIKYGVTSIDNLVNDLSTWDNLYLAGRLHKPVKILRDHPQVRLANQHNLIAALRTALLLLPPRFSETDLYSTIAGLSYLGDPRMALPTEDKSKINNIVSHNVVHFRRLYAPLVKTLPNVAYAHPVRLDDDDWILDPAADSALAQDMDPRKRGNMVRRLPKHFRSRLYFQYQKKLAMPNDDFRRMIDEADSEDCDAAGPGDRAIIRRRQGGQFERRIAADDPQQLKRIVRQVIKQTVNWPSTAQSAKGLLMGGWRRSMRYLGDKFAKWRKGRSRQAAKGKAGHDSSSNKSD
ncbi:mitochondrial matrix domain-containing protein [Hirsutella rhossiliensis]|uniref:Phosphatidate cytidylyltransferase, mitochondrial n=1 Tax=Hirsutella rhossiliensis TaxID=111463 RepID=A0A9P8MTG2_9HYPO|nr:mitochondrial matrix domain-containing protein [Hirsutella rhossiliensis]KAH0961112.1 mitochondrial matrix domain-containing protein [Hirsutella rhossiliensis]